MKTALLCGLLALMAACAGPLAPADDGARLQIEVAPLQLDGVTNATYTLTVVNADGVTVWTRTVDSDGFGDGSGSLSYIGPCDAGGADATNTNTNTVQLVLDQLDDDDGPLTDGVDYVNPAPAGQPLTRSAACRDNEDTSVTFELTIARRASQGFFDVAVSLSSLFCSAKLDCVKADGDDADSDPDPLYLLHDGTTRGRSLVLGLACTGGQSADTHLYMDDIVIDCGAAGTMTLSPDDPPGNKGAASPMVFQHAVYFGTEPLGGYHKAYWNTVVGIYEANLTATDPCVLTTTATAAAAALDNRTTPEGATWPVITWDVTLNSFGNAALTCGRHQLDVSGSGVAIDYVTAEELDLELDSDWGDGGQGGSPSVNRGPDPPTPPQAPLFPADSLFVTMGGGGSEWVYYVPLARDGAGVPSSAVAPTGFAQVNLAQSSSLTFGDGGLGPMYVPNAVGQVQVFQPDGSSAVYASGLPSGHISLAGVAQTPNGDLFIGDFGNDAVYLIPPGGGAGPFSAVITNATHGLDLPGSFGLDPITGDVWVPSYSSNQVFKRTPAGVVTEVVSSGTAISNLVVTCSGRVFGSDHIQNGRIFEIDPVTGAMSVHATGIYYPEGLTVDDQGWMYTVGNGGWIYAFNETPGVATPIRRVVVSDLDGIAWVGDPCP